MPAFQPGQLTRTQIIAAYQNAFGRKPSTNEFNYWHGKPSGQLQTALRATPSAGGIYKTPTPDVPLDVPKPDTSFNQQDFIDKIVASLYPKTTPPPSFENSGLYNEGDTMAQAHQDYDPTFALEQQNLQRQQQTGQGQQLSDYYNRGLSHSGALVGAQNLLGQQQGFATNDLKQNQLSTLAGIKNNAYQQAFGRYLNQYGTK